MKRPLRIVLAVRETETLTSLRPLLARLGHEVQTVAHTGPELVEQCQQHRPDLILADLELQDGSIAGALRNVRALPLVPVILMASDPDELLEADVEAPVGYLFQPVAEPALCSAISFVGRCFAQLQNLQQQVDELQQTLADRKLIERAKGILTRRLYIDEPDAFARMRKLASDHNRKQIDIARQVIQSDEIFWALEQIGSRTPCPEGPDRG